MNDDFPLAYHITFGTYGTRLHGDPRGTVDRSHNRPGDPILGADPSRWQREQGTLRYPAVFLTDQQRQHVEAEVACICQRGGWEYIICSAASDHLHTLLSAAAEGAAVRKWFKRWLGETLSERWPLPDGQSWWAEGGSVKHVWDEDYLENVYGYISGQRTTPA